MTIIVMNENVKEVITNFKEIDLDRKVGNILEHQSLPIHNVVYLADCTKMEAFTLGKKFGKALNPWLYDSGNDGLIFLSPESEDYTFACKVYKTMEEETGLDAPCYLDYLDYVDTKEEAFIFGRLCWDL